ncbi:MAG: hypothetical protein ACF8Q5_10145 [Phycisphaerales bacterium JB040]
MHEGGTKLGTPVCANCAYDLSGAVTSATCPECGKPLVEVLDRVSDKNPNYQRYTSSARLFGHPLVHVAFGADPGQKMAHARGIIAVGEDAVGLVAVGSFTRGGLCIGGIGCGVVTCCGLNVGVVSVGGLIIAGFLGLGGMVVSGYYAFAGFAAAHAGRAGFFYQLW